MEVVKCIQCDLCVNFRRSVWCCHGISQVDIKNYVWQHEVMFYNLYSLEIIYFNLKKLLKYWKRYKTTIAYSNGFRKQNGPILSSDFLGVGQSVTREAESGF